MKKMKTTWVFLSGLVAGLVLTLCIGAAEKDKTADNDLSKLQWIGYPSGATGVFDPATGKLYIYDSNVQYCNIIREMKVVGDPMTRVRN
jgi:hypothetical protein